MRGLLNHGCLTKRPPHTAAALIHSTATRPPLHDIANPLPTSSPATSVPPTSVLPHLSSRAFQPFRFDPKTPCAASPTLPSSFYHAPAVLEWERQSVFSSNWLYVGHIGQFPAPDSYFTGSFLSVPYVVVRTATNRITAYYNVCCHHAMPLCTAPSGTLTQGAQGEAELVCGYHGWRYGAEDGRLRKATRLKGIQDFKASTIGLAGIAVQVVGPFIFAHLSPASAAIASGVASARPPPPSTAHLQQLHAVLAPTGYTSLVHCARRSYRLRCNWKVFTDNYLDGGYHVSHAHQALASALDLTKYTTSVLSSHLSLQSAPASHASGARISTAASYLYLYPQLMVNRYGRLMDTNVVIPITETECDVVIDWWSDSELSDSEREAAVSESEAVQVEDIALCEGVQRGLQSGIYVSGRYAPTVEHAMHAMHCTYYSDVTSLAAATDTADTALT